jgi:hypothetical protein
MGYRSQFLKAAIDKAAPAGVAQERHHSGGVTNGEDEGSSAISFFNA